MTTIESAQPPALDLQDPTAGHTEIVPDPNPAQGPDGRLTGGDSIQNQTPTKVITPDDGNKTNEAQEKRQSNEETSLDVSKTDKDKPKVTEIRILEPDKEKKKEEIPDHVIDIVKQSKLQDTHRSGSDIGELSHSRPLTETSLRDGTKASVDTEKEKRDIKTEPGRDTKTPFSVKVERKPLHTAQTRSHSDYFSKTPSTSRFTYIAASLSQYTGFQPDFKGRENFFQQVPEQQMRARRPPKLVRLATVTMSPKTKPAPRGPSLYYEEPKKPSKVITWDEATDARPPLRIDMEGPGPTNYSPMNKPLYETNSPAWSFGSRCQPEKVGGSRTSWEKTWFCSPSVWTNKVDFYNDSAWPSPTHYKARPMLGPRQRTLSEAPSFTIGVRNEMTINKSGSDKEPSPVDYDKDLADKLTLRRGPSYSHQFRREGTIMWGSQGKTPGPGAYTPNYSFNKRHGPSYSIRNLRREKSHVLGPFSTF